jgi:hypothetical protein
MQQEMTTTTVSRRFSSNRAARESPYPFGHPGLAGEPAGLESGPDLAWPGQIRPAFLFFSSILFNC